MTGHSIRLSLTTVDILWEHLRLGPAVFPFETPQHGETLRERASIRDTVFADLERHGLARGGRCAHPLEQALSILTSAATTVTAVGSLGHGTPLRARAAATTTTGVLAVLDGQHLVLRYVGSNHLVPAVVDLLPNERPGPGQSISVVEAAHTAGERLRLRTAQSYLARPRLRVGQFGITVRDPSGATRTAPRLGWFDTDRGRYLCQATPGRDGGQWVTFAPGDDEQLKHYLETMISDLDRRRVSG